MCSSLSAVIFFSFALSMAFSINECYYAWNEVIPGTGTCTSAADCKDSAADCTFSIVTNTHICCRPKAGAVLPKCPSGKTLLSIGKNSAMVCSTNDQCPDNFECLTSTTNFDKLPGQSNKVCCT